MGMGESLKEVREGLSVRTLLILVACGNSRRLVSHVVHFTDGRPIPREAGRARSKGWKHSIRSLKLLSIAMLQQPRVRFFHRRAGELCLSLSFIPHAGA